MSDCGDCRYRLGGLGAPVRGPNDGVNRHA